MALFRKQQLVYNLKSTRTTNIHYTKQPQSVTVGAITDFVWKDYSSLLFRDIQELREIKFEDYISSICRHDILVELAKSRGSDRPFYHFSDDKQFIIKSLHKSEAKVLIEMLPSYYEYIKKHETSLLAKYCGLHAARPACGGPKVYFVVMENVLQTELPLDMKYDLKGTSKGRTPGQRDLDPGSSLLKDPDFNFCFFLDPPTRTQLLEQIRLDCKFLAEQGLMNYSLLLGVQIESPELENGGNSSIAKALELQLQRDSSLSYLVPGHTSRLNADLVARAIQIPQSKMERKSRWQRPRAEEASMKVYLYLGIVDVLQNYNVTKRIEHAYKSLQYDPKAIPCVKPQPYAARFQDFFSKVFPSEED